MNPWLHPQGHESAQTYWLRRLGVFAVLALVIALIIWGIAALAGRGSSSAVPAVETSPTSSPASTSGASESPSAEGTSAGSPSPSEVSPAASSSGSSSSSSASSAPSASASESPSSSGSPSSNPSRSDGSTSSPEASPSATPTPKESDEGQTCTLDDLVLNLRGAPQVRSGRSTTYRIWVTNAAEVPCAIGLKEQPLQLEITSGTDRIWSTRDCVKLAPSGILKIRAGETRVFPVTWTTQRSRSGCTLVDEELRGGTYWAKVTWGQYSKTYRTVLYL